MPFLPGIRNRFFSGSRIPDPKPIRVFDSLVTNFRVKSIIILNTQISNSFKLKLSVRGTVRFTELNSAYTEYKQNLHTKTSQFGALVGLGIREKHPRSATLIFCCAKLKT